MPERHVSIVVYTDTGIFTGILFLPTGMRLSHFINLSAQFLHLKNDSATDDIENEDTIGEIHHEIHLNKKAIYFLTTSIADGKGGFTQEKVFPYVRKKSVAVKISMTDYEISGNLHSVDEKSLTPLLERNRPFLPCTDVTVNDIRNNNTWHINFVAVNQNKISVITNI